jgi:hypothetical protein
MHITYDMKFWDTIETICNAAQSIVPMQPGNGIGVCCDTVHSIDGMIM